MNVAMPRYQDASRESVGAPVFRLAAAIGLHIALLAWLAHAPPLLVTPPIVRHTRMDVHIVESVTAPPAPRVPPKQLTRAIRPNNATLTNVGRTLPLRSTPEQSAERDGGPASEPSAVEERGAAHAKQDASAAPLLPSQPVAVVTPARFDADYLRNPAPAYPSISRRLHEEGTVLLQVVVSSSGEAERVRIKQGSGYPRLDEVAVKTVQQWRFVPARHGNEAVAASIAVPIVFRLDG